jgi:hypothetical protein
VRLPTSSVDTAARTVSAPLAHFSSYALIAAEDLSAADAYAFPVPFRPHGPNSGSGAGRTGREETGITFTELPAQGTIEVFNVRGERVWRSDIPNASGQLRWDVRNQSGQPVASGVYLYVIQSPKDKKTGKLAIVR